MNFSSFKVKALTASLILLSSSGVAFAKNYKGEPVYKGEVPCPAPVTLKDGFYVGAQAGYDAYRVRESTTGAATGPLGTTTVSSNPAVAATGWVGGLFVGYGRYLTDLFYLGGEIFADYSGAQENHNTGVSTTLGGGATGNLSTKIEARGSAGLGLLPGIKLNDTSLGYVRLGWNWVNMKATQDFTGTTGSASGSNTDTTNGFVFGFGLETLLWDNWSVRGEFDHTYYKSFNAGSTSYDPSDNQYTMGILYHFA